MTDFLSTPGWIPFDLVRDGTETLLEWRFIGRAPLRKPWFEYDVRAQHHSVNGGFRPRRTPIEALDDGPPSGALPLAGMIFHASRCGSTLMAGMLACSPRLSVLAEPPIVESMINWSHDRGDQARLLPRLQAALGYLGRRRLASEEALVLKAESEHIIDLPLFERAFPNVPWIFLFREPAAILRSQHRERGRQMVPYMIHPGRLGLSHGEVDPARLDEYCAVVLERTFAAAVEHVEAGSGRAVHYRRLPDYVWAEADGHFSLGLGDAEIEAMRERSGYHAKGAGGLAYDGGAGREGAPLEVFQALARGPLQERYERLSAL